MFFHYLAITVLIRTPFLTLVSRHYDVVFTAVDKVEVFFEKERYKAKRVLSESYKDMTAKSIKEANSMHGVYFWPPVQ